MRKPNQQKILDAYQLLSEGIPYREIQTILKDRYGTGMSNTTLKNMQLEQAKSLHTERSLQEELRECRKELALYKNLYFELLDAMKKSLASKE